MIVDAHHGLIGHEAPVISQILHGYSGYGVSEGHGKEDVTSKVSDPPFTNLVKEVTTTKNSCSLDEFLVVKLTIK